jgi:hypothetical protein
MCIIHKGFRGFRAASHVSILGGKLDRFEARNPLRNHTLTVSVSWLRKRNDSATLIKFLFCQPYNKFANAHLAHLQAPTHESDASACKRAKF